MTPFPLVRPASKRLLAAVLSAGLLVAGFGAADASAARDRGAAKAERQAAEETQTSSSYSIDSRKLR